MNIPSISNNLITLNGIPTTHANPDYDASLQMTDLCITGRRGDILERTTIFTPSSVSKAVLGVELMQSVEKGVLGMNQPINHILPFPVVNPNDRTPI